MQIRNGTVDVTNGSSTVIGNDTTWLSDVEPGGLFGIVRDQALQEISLYEVVDVVSDTELSLSVPYAGESAESVQYTIDQDFTKDGFVLMQNGDRNTAAIYSRTVKKIQERFDNIPAMGDINELLELAEGYVEDAEAAQGASEQARDISVAAKEDSEQARDDALLYRQGAEQAEANAELHAQDANQAKEAAEDSQQAAAAHEQGASAARIAAEQAQQASEDARDISISKADESAQSAASAEQANQNSQAIEVNVTNLHGEVESNTLTVSNLADQVADDRSQVASDKQDVRDDRDEVRGLKTETQIFRNQSEQFKNDAEAAAASAAGGLLPVGGWDASTGNLPPAPSDNTQPWYRITEGGTLPGIGEVGVGDNIYWSSTFEDWFHIDNTERFTSINGYTGGAVELDTGDIPENGPQFHTQARVRGSSLTGLSESSSSKPSATDTVISALGKIVSKLWSLAIGDVSGLQGELDSKANAGTGSNEVRTNSQNDSRFGRLTENNTWTSYQDFSGGGINFQRDDNGTEHVYFRESDGRERALIWADGGFGNNGLRARVRDDVGGYSTEWRMTRDGQFYLVKGVFRGDGTLLTNIPSSAINGLGSTGNEEFRNNQQNDGRFAQLNQSNTYTGMQHFHRTGTVMAFSGDLLGTRIDLHRERVEEIPESTYEDLGFVPNSDLLLRYRLGSSNSTEENLSGVVFSRYNTSNVLAIGMRNTGAGGGVAAGNPDGGLKGIGSINAETIYSNGTEVFEDASGVYTAGSGALSNAVSNMLSADTNDQIRTAIGAGTGDGDAVIGTGGSQVRTNAQNDARYMQPGAFGLGSDGETINDASPNQYWAGMYRLGTASSPFGSHFGVGFGAGFGTRFSATRWAGVHLDMSDRNNVSFLFSDTLSNTVERRKAWHDGNLTFSLSGTTLTITDNS